MKPDLTNMKFGRFTIVGIGKRTDKNLYWLCRCECGNERLYSHYSLRKSIVVSCGCYHKEIMTKHGDNPNYATKDKKRSTEYRTWEGITSRCLNKNNPSYINYGARGISVCDRWRYSYINFLNDMGRKPWPSMTLDRINNDGNYEPSNCRWTTWTVQNNNRRLRSSYRGKPIFRNLITKS